MTVAPDYGDLLAYLEDENYARPAGHSRNAEAAAAIRNLVAEREGLREALNATSARNRTLARKLRGKKLRVALSGRGKA